MAPAHLDPDEKKIWKELGRLLPKGVARNADRFAFELISSLMWRQRSEGLRGADLSCLVGLLSRFGLDPSSRAKVAAPASTNEDETNPFTQFA